MNVELDPRLERYVAEKVKNGTFASADAAVNDALEQARLQEELTAEDVAELRAMIAVGAEQADRGEVAPWDPAELKKRLREQLGRMKAS
jgi:putative addiction module CopG family antidote